MVLKCSTTVWFSRQRAALLRQEGIMEKLKEENLRCKATSEESMRRATSMMMGGQASLVIREAFTGCIDVLAQLIQERRREELLQLELTCGDSFWQKLGLTVAGEGQPGAEEFGYGLA